VIRLLAFEPTLHNQNGDLANLTMIARVLESVGVPVSIGHEEWSAESFLSCDLALVGDASIAAMGATATKFLELPDLIKSRNEAGRLTLLVGSSYERLAGSLLSLTPTPSPRFSGFSACEFSGEVVWGYVNTIVELPRIFRRGSIIGTQFFGPLLARNPSLVRQIISAWGLETNLDILEQIQDLMIKSPNYAEALKTLR